MRRLGLIAAACAACLAPAPAAARADAAGPRLMVTFRSSADAGDRAAARAAVDARALHAIAGPRVQAIRVGPDGPATAAAAIRALERRPDVAYAEPDIAVHATVVPNDSLFSLQWGLNNTGQTIQGSTGTADADIDAPEAWATTTGSPAVVIGVVDTGMDSTHPDLNPNLWTNTAELNGAPGVDDDGDGVTDDVHGWDFVQNDATPDDGNGHGTHVAGIAAAAGNNSTGVTGVSWRSTLLPVRALGSDGSGSMSDIIAAFEYAADRGARIVNMSLGGAGTSQTFLAALNRHPDTLLVAAAGNDGTDNDSAPQSPCNEPAPNVVCVAATDNHDALAGFSNYGDQTVDLGAPGVSIASTYPANRYVYLDGTSMATPMVSGAAALLLAADPSADVADLRAWLVGFGDPVASLSGKTVSGRRLNAAASLQAIGGAVPSAPVADSGQPPTASGQPVQGAQLSGTGGHFYGAAPLSVAIHWQRCDSAGQACQTVDGADGPTYTLTGDDVGHRIRVLADATNAYGEATAGSAATPVVTQPLPPSIPASAPSGTAPANPSPPAAREAPLELSVPARTSRRAVARAGALTVNVRLPRAGRLTVLARVSRATARRLGLRARTATVTLASVRTRTLLSGVLRVRLPLPAGVRKRLARRSATVTLSAELVGSTGVRYRTTLRVTLR